MLTRIIPILPTENATGDVEDDMWADIASALGCMSQAETVEHADQKVKDAIDEGRLDPKWADARKVKITIEKI